MLLVRSSLVQKAEKSHLNEYKEDRKENRSCCWSLPPYHWDSATWLLKTQVNKKLIMEARALVGAFSILLLLHNPQESQTPGLCKASKHNLIYLQFPPPAVTVNTEFMRSLFHECIPSSMAFAGVLHFKCV